MSQLFIESLPQKFNLPHKNFPPLSITENPAFRNSKQTAAFTRLMNVPFCFRDASFLRRRLSSHDGRRAMCATLRRRGLLSLFSRRKKQVRRRKKRGGGEGFSRRHRRFIFVREGSRFLDKLIDSQSLLVLRKRLPFVSTPPPPTPANKWCEKSREAQMFRDVEKSGNIKKSSEIKWSGESFFRSSVKNGAFRVCGNEVVMGEKGKRNSFCSNRVKSFSVEFSWKENTYFWV